AMEANQKVEDYLRGGVRLVWVIDPEAHTVLIYRGDGSIGGLREQDELSGEEGLPGFRARVGDPVLPPPGAGPGRGSPWDDRPIIACRHAGHRAREFYLVRRKGVLYSVRVQGWLNLIDSTEPVKMPGKLSFLGALVGCEGREEEDVGCRRPYGVGGG